MPYAQGGTVSGTGQIIRKDGTKVEFTVTSDPLTEEQAAELNAQEGEKDGSNTSDNNS